MDTLHITNGDSITERLLQLRLVNDNVVVWREMLCEGPTQYELEKKSAILKRKEFLNQYYQIPPKVFDQKFVTELDKIKNIKQYNEIILWFEYDLFCQVNMIAVISLLIRNHIKNIPIYLVCSGRVEEEKGLKGLGELTDQQLIAHYQNKILLNQDDLILADYVWALYCESNPKKIAAAITRKSSFPYLSIALRAHLQRFPNMLTGLNVLEHNILKMISSHDIKNLKQLMGYALEYQGYYGYGDMQMKRVIARLFQFLKQTQDQLLLSERGKLALEEKKNFYTTQNLDWYYGGVRKFDYLYNNETHSLLKL